MLQHMDCRVEVRANDLPDPVRPKSSPSSESSLGPGPCITVDSIDIGNKGVATGFENCVELLSHPHPRTKKKFFEDMQEPFPDSEVGGEWILVDK